MIPVGTEHGYVVDSPLIDKHVRMHFTVAKNDSVIIPLRFCSGIVSELCPTRAP